MKVKFKIEEIIKTGKKKDLIYVLAKCLEQEKDFTMTDNARLGEVPINNSLTQPRALNKNGQPRFDLYIFNIRYKKDVNQLTKGQIITLIP
ncbi:MAG: hypothetical protein AB8G86_17290 [Saprospiraceae bacterium]